MLTQAEYNDFFESLSEEEKKIPLHSALYKGNEDAAIYYLNQPNRMSINKRGSNGETALHIASIKGYTNIVKLLVSRRALVDKSDYDGFKPLMAASRNGYLEIVSMLLNGGATAMDKDDGKITPLMTAAYHGHKEIVILLVRSGAFVNKVDDKGQTSLMLAAGRGHTEIVEFLVENGADVDAVSCLGINALMLAAGFGRVDVLKFLISKMSTLFAQSNSGDTALTYAIKSKQNQVVNILNPLFKQSLITRPCGIKNIYENYLLSKSTPNLSELESKYQVSLELQNRPEYLFLVLLEIHNFPAMMELIDLGLIVEDFDLYNNAGTNRVYMACLNIYKINQTKANPNISVTKDVFSNKVAPNSGQYIYLYVNNFLLDLLNPKDNYNLNGIFHTDLTEETLSEIYTICGLSRPVTQKRKFEENVTIDEEKNLPKSNVSGGLTASKLTANLGLN